MSDSGSEKDFCKRVNAFTQSAVEELDRRHRQRLCALVERELNRRFHRREDPEDVVQSVFKVFFARVAAGEFHIEHPGALWQLLKEITRHKIFKHVGYHVGEKRDAKKEVYPEDDQFPARDPSPAEWNLLANVLETVLDGLEPLDSEIVQLKLLGYTIPEIRETILVDLKPLDTKTFRLCLQGWSLVRIASHLCSTRATLRCMRDRSCNRLKRLVEREAARQYGFLRHSRRRSGFLNGVL